MAHRSKTSQQEILTVEEVENYLKVTERSIYSLLSRQEIPAFKVGGSWRFRRDEIETWTRAKPKKPKARKE